MLYIVPVTQLLSSSACYRDDDDDNDDDGNDEVIVYLLSGIRYARCCAVTARQQWTTA